MVQLKLSGNLQNSIRKGSIVDGEGIRVVLFTQGCSHHCPKCHNPETWNKQQGVAYSIDEVVNYLVPLFRSGRYDGLTLSGGDPMMQATEIHELLRKLKQVIPNLNIWCYTGYRYEEIPNRTPLQYIDVLVDGKFEIEKRYPTVPFRGSSNQRIIRLVEGVAISFE